MLDQDPDHLIHMVKLGFLETLDNFPELSSLDLEYQDKDGYTALMYASIANHVALVTSLIRLGVEIDARNQVR